MNEFTIITGICSILSLVISILAIRSTYSLKKEVNQNVKGNKNQTAGRDIKTNGK